MTVPLRTVGHGTLPTEALAGLLVDAGVRAVVDIRRFPGSRRQPHLARDALAVSLPDAGLQYRWEPRLGGRRHTPAAAEPTDTWWRVAAFRAYAAHTRTAEFGDALEDLVRQAREVPTAVMCSESLWWRCHRRLVADAVVLLADAPVEHLAHDGRVTVHEPSDGARAAPGGGLTYPGADA